VDHRVIDVKRVNERIMWLKVLIGDNLVTCICAYAPQQVEVLRRKILFGIK